MKYLELDERNEKLLVAVFDAALKAQGMSVVAYVNELSGKVKEKPADQPKE